MGIENIRGMVKEAKLLVKIRRVFYKEKRGHILELNFFMVKYGYYDEYMNKKKN